MRGLFEGLVALGALGVVGLRGCVFSLLVFCEGCEGSGRSEHRCDLGHKACAVRCNVN